MATSREMDELRELEQTRSRLETTLGRDENWRALIQPGTDAQDGSGASARRTRDTRLEMALAGNPFYQAWTHVTEAIRALRERSADLAAAAEPSASARPDTTDHEAAAPIALSAAHGHDASAGHDPWAGDLPQEIVDRIRGGQLEESASDVQARPSTPATAGEDNEPESEEAEAEESEDEEPTEAPATSRSRLIPSVSAIPAREEKAATAATPPPGEPAPSTEEAAASPSRETGPRAGKRTPPTDDWEEATVTFVTRVPRRSTSPARHDVDAKASLAERLRDAGDAPDSAEEMFPSHNESVEEAEVTILTAEGLKARAEAEERAATLRRFGKALQGE